MVEGVDHVVVKDAVLAGAGSDERRIHLHKLACVALRRKLPCMLARSRRTAVRLAASSSRG
jgi:hypothetical protein